MSEWKPIETAPQDETRIVIVGPIFHHYGEDGGQVWSAQDYACVSSRLDAEGNHRPRYGKTKGHENDGWEFLVPGISTVIIPTHWMPLPESLDVT